MTHRHRPPCLPPRSDGLITYLCKRVGRVDHRLSIVKAHKEINPVPTDCPGNRFSYTWLHRKFD